MNVASQEKQQEQVSAFFKSQSAQYRRLFNDSERTGASVLFKQRRDIVARYTAGRSGTLLDCAVGTGEIALEVIAGGNYKGAWFIDINHSMLQEARATFAQRTIASTHLNWIVSDIFSLPLKPGCPAFDVVLCLGLIAHVGRLDELFGILRAITASGGLVVLQSSVGDYYSSLVIRRVTDWRAKRGKSHKIFYFTIPELVSAAERHGFKLLTLKKYGVCIPFGDRIFPRLNYHVERRLFLHRHDVGGEAILLFEKIAA